MRYLCSHCGAQWEQEGEPTKCPTCLRKHGILPVEDEPLAERTKARVKGFWSRKRILVVAAAAVVVVGGAGIAAWYLLGPHRSAGPKPRRILGPQPEAALRRALREAGVEKSGIPFRATERVRKWARGRLAGGPDRGAALREALRGLLAPKGSWRPVRIPDSTTVLDADTLLEKAGGRVHGFALACLGVAAARALGWKAVLVEIHETKAVPGPADPTGRVGRFGVALFARSYADERPEAVVDPLASEPGGARVYTLLDDVSALGAYLNLKAQAVAGQDPATARILAEAAGKLAPNSPTVQCGRGTLLLALGDVTGGMSALELARAKRDDGPRHLCLAQGYLAQHDVASALAELRKAVSKAPKYAEAYALQAKVYLAVGQVAKAQEMVDRAAEIEPKGRTVRLVRAMLAATQGQVSEAEKTLKALLDEEPSDFEVFLALWQLYQGTGRAEDARALAEKFSSGMPAAAREHFQAQLERIAQAMAQARGQASGGSPDQERGGQSESAPAPPVPPTIPGGGPAPMTPPPRLDFKLKAPGPGSGKGPAGQYRLKF